jgi:hypothetical protein
MSQADSKSPDDGMLSLKLLVTLLSELSGSPMLLLTLGKDLTPLVFGWSEVTPQLL